MSERANEKGKLPAAARVLGALGAEEELPPTRPSARRRAGALVLALLMLAATPLYFATGGVGLTGDTPVALAKGKSGAGDDDDDDRLGPRDDEADEITFLRTDDTSADNRTTRGTTRDHDTHTRTRGGTNDTSGDNRSTVGTTRDNDTRSNTLFSATGTQTGTQTQTRTGRRS